VSEPSSNSLWNAITWRLNRPLGRTIRRALYDALGPRFTGFEVHEKSFPGYDVASVNIALLSILQECCTKFKTIGGISSGTLNNLLDMLRTPAYRNLQPLPLGFMRVPVDVEQDESFVINGLYTAELLPEAGANFKRPSASLTGEQPARPSTQPEPIAVHIGIQYSPEYWEGLETSHAPRNNLLVGVLCKRRDIADRFFAELNDRRRRFSIYRGKVIDPILAGGVIQSIGFRRIQKVELDDLILPATVCDLIQRSIVGFYQHRDRLRTHGIDLKRGILFHGPPGTGKTSISLYLAQQLPGLTVCFVSGERLLYPREICRMARYLQPAMVVFEDIDLVAQERDSMGLATVLGELMNQIDGCDPDEEVLFIMNTNSLERLEHAVKNRPGRVDQIISVPLPTSDERRQLFQSFAKAMRLDLAVTDQLLEATDTLTPAAIKEVVKRGAVNALDRVSAQVNGETLPVSEADLLLAVQQVRAMRDPEQLPGSLGFRSGR
jgi:hypothetical protein